MKIHIKKRCFVRIVSFAIAICLAFLGSVIKLNYNLNSTKRQLIHRYQSAMEDLSSEIEGMAITLGKALYTGTPTALTVLTNELVLQAGSASAALSALPTNHNNLETISKFLSQVSDYSLSLTKKVVSGGTITEQERDTLKKLADVASNLSTRLDEAKTMYNDSENWANNLEAALSGAESITGIDTSFTDAEESLNEYPTLIYDGPFSDHIQDKESKLLNAAKEIGEDSAKKLAANVAGVGEANITFSGSEEGKTPAYVFSTGVGSVAVTKRGGYTLYLRNEREIATAQISYEEAVKKAEEYIKSLEMGSFTTSYYFADEGVCVVNFAYTQADTICYTDLIKVGVALDNGEVVFYEARGYIMNHHPRTLKVPQHTAEEAKQKLSTHLRVQNIALSVIPSGGEHELYCYEFHCLGDDNEELLVYINTETLVEEKILILLKTDGGTLTK